MNLTPQQRVNALSGASATKALKRPPTVVDWDVVIPKFKKMMAGLYRPEPKKPVKKAAVKKAAPKAPAKKPVKKPATKAPKKVPPPKK